jgi:hypothetical protein
LRSSQRHWRFSDGKWLGPEYQHPTKHQMNLYRGMDQATFDTAYNNSAAVSDSARITAGREQRSARLCSSRAALSTYAMTLPSARASIASTPQREHHGSSMAAIGRCAPRKKPSTFSPWDRLHMASACIHRLHACNRKMTRRHRRRNFNRAGRVGATGRIHPSFWLANRR